MNDKALDPKGLEAAARAVELRLQFVPHGGKNCFGEWTVTMKETENFHRECEGAAHTAISAYLSAPIPEDVARLVERLNAAHEAIKRHAGPSPVIDEAATALTSLAVEREG